MHTKVVLLSDFILFSKTHNVINQIHVKAVCVAHRSLYLFALSHLLICFSLTSPAQTNLDVSSQSLSSPLLIKCVYCPLTCLFTFIAAQHSENKLCGGTFVLDPGFLECRHLCILIYCHPIVQLAINWCFISPSW